MNYRLVETANGLVTLIKQPKYAFCKDYAFVYLCTFVWYKYKYIIIYK